jgi:glutathione-regulated potassium-efflux system ancillary protein KefG
LLAPFDQTAHLCGMRYLAPFVVHRSLSIAGAADAAPHARAWRAAVAALAAGDVDLDLAAAAERLNDVIPSVSLSTDA